MMNTEHTTGASLFRLVGFMGLGVGVAWALQIAGANFGGSPVDKLMWILSAAALAGASFGLIVVSGTLLDESPISVTSDVGRS